MPRLAGMPFSALRRWRTAWNETRGLRKTFGTLRRAGDTWHVLGKYEGQDFPLTIRNGTTDVFALQSILIREVYRLDFAPLSHLIGAPAGVFSRGKFLIVDCGANIGLSALYFQCVFPCSRIIAIEADQANFESLCRQSFAPLIGCEHAAVNDIVEPLCVKPGAHGEWGRTVCESGEPGVPCRTLNDIFSGNTDYTPFLVKIDIEGSESRLFRSNLEWFDRTPIVVIELHDWMDPDGVTSRELIRALAVRERLIVPRNDLIWIISPELVRESIKTACG